MHHLGNKVFSANANGVAWKVSTSKSRVRDSTEIRQFLIRGPYLNVYNAIGTLRGDTHPLISTDISGARYNVAAARRDESLSCQVVLPTIRKGVLYKWFSEMFHI